jgi:putative DNA methylase
LKRKLIEVSLPLEVINTQAAREKSIRQGHPATLHLWWARRPLAAARAVLFAQLVDDPSSHPEKFPTEDHQRRERERLHGIIERLVVWENTRDEALLAEAHQEILNSTDGNPPPILDLFAGGGTIPLEAQRLGLEAHASDLNPVAVLINKALIEIPPKFAGKSPVFQGVAEGKMGWPRATGLAADVRAYGEWMRDEAERRIGKHYPKATLDNGEQATVIAWIWARTVTCPNPACGIEMPLVRSWWLGKKKGKQAWVRPVLLADAEHPSGKRIEFEIGRGTVGAPQPDDGTMDGRRGGICVACGGATSVDHVRDEATAGRMGQVLLATVALANRQRNYLPPDAAHIAAAQVARPADGVGGTLSTNPRWFSPPAYGLTEFSDLFTNRQLLALTTFSDLVVEAREQILDDALSVGIPAGARLEAGGTGAEAYADAVATYLGLGVSRTADLGNSLATWSSSRDQTRNLFARQAVPMAWDFVEVSPFAGASGDVAVATATMSRAIESLPAAGPSTVSQADAISVAGTVGLISTDPPYYDNIGYSDLSDFFYVWLRRSLREVYPDLLATMLVPKAQELVANPYRHDGKDGAKEFFEDGFRQVFARARESAVPDYPITVYYAFKQSETDEAGRTSTGWETLLEGMIHSGWEITSTWPLRSERGGRMTSVGTNALASSIVLSLRPRPTDAPLLDRRGYLDLLREELPTTLRELQHGTIAPVDLAQAAIGPGMAVFSRFSRVVEPNGSDVTVREALRLIHGVLGEVLSDQEGDFDTDTRWCVKWFETHGFDKASYGEAETLAGAYNTSVAGLDRSGAVYAKAGDVRLLTISELAQSFRPERDEHITLWEVAMHLVKALDESGLAEAGRIVNGASARVDLEAVKELAYLVFSLAEKRSMGQVAGAFNALVTSWPEVRAAAKALASTTSGTTEQAMLFVDDELAN